MTLTHRLGLRFAGSFVGLAFCLGLNGAALAGQPRPWQLGFQEAATPVMRDIVALHDFLLGIIIVIALFVTALMIYVMWRFNAKRNPVPTTTTHNTKIEVLWTVIPVIILVVIAIPSFRLLYFSDVVPKADLTVKAIGHQWYWSYEYPDHGNFSFDSVMIPDDEIKAGQLRLLEVDNRVVVPINKTVRVIVTADDVLHAWAVPAIGVKIDAVPARLNETWFKADREGVYYGQCSELCGTNHGYMPIRVDVVSQEKFDAWVKKARKEFANDDAPDGTRESVKFANNAPAAR